MGTVKPNINIAWAENGTKIDPGAGKYNTGWVGLGEKPPYQSQNYIQNRADVFSKHVNEFGVCQWDAITTYSISSLVLASNGLLYQSLQNTNQNNDPSVSPAFWKEYSAGGNFSVLQRVKVVRTTFDSTALGFTYLPAPTSPLNTTGKQYMSLSITPKEIGSIIAIEAYLPNVSFESDWVSNPERVGVITTLNSSAIANSLAAEFKRGARSGTIFSISSSSTLRYEFVSNSITAHNFNVKFVVAQRSSGGSQTPAYIGGIRSLQVGAPIFVPQSMYASLIITEYRQ